MITITMDDHERYEKLKYADIKIIPWDKERELAITSPDETISQALRRFAKECQLIGKEITMSEIPEKVRITKKTVGESIATMRRQQADLLNLGKLFTVMEEVLHNAVLIEVEPFFYTHLNKAKLIESEYQYLGAFRDKKMIYPVKITVERYKKGTYTNVHVIVTVGKIQIVDLFDDLELKRSVAYTGLHPPKDGGESLLSEDASFTITIQQLVRLFNTHEGIILKNLPDEMLSEEQKQIKALIRSKDARRIEERRNRKK